MKKYIVLGTTILTGVLLLASLATFFLPLMRAEMKPVFDKRWSAWQVVEPLPKAFTKKGSGTSTGTSTTQGTVTRDVDYMDVLQKILPKNETTKEPSKLSPVFINGVLVPVALIVAYLGTLLACLLFFWSRKWFYPFLLALNFSAALYAIFGVTALGVAAKRAFEKAVDAQTSQWFGIVTKYFVSEVVIAPDVALYVMCWTTISALAVLLIRNQLAK